MHTWSPFFIIKLINKIKMIEMKFEICDELILHANTKEEVLEVALEMWPDTNAKILKEYIAKKWKDGPIRNKISLVHTGLKDRFMILNHLLVKKQVGEITRIYVYINKCLSKHTPHDLYVRLIGREGMSNKNRDLMRGKKVELVSFTNDRVKILVKEIGNKNELYCFSVWDINARHYIETE